MKGKNNFRKLAIRARRVMQYSLRIGKYKSTNGSYTMFDVRHEYFTNGGILNRLAADGWSMLFETD